MRLFLPACAGILFVLLGLAAGESDIRPSPLALGYPSLDSPNCIAYHPEGLWVVSDTGGDRIVLLNMDLTLNSSLEGELTRPRGVAVDGEGRIWIADGGNDRVLATDLQLNVLEVLGSSGDGPGEFNLPWGVAVDHLGRLAVSDALNRRVQVFGTDLGPPLILGSWGTGPGQFDGPIDLAFDSGGRLHVCDIYLEAEGYVRRVQVFNSDLSFNGTIWDISNRLRFTRPTGIGISPGGLIAVADSVADRVYFFDAVGAHVGGLTRVDGQPSIDSPYDVAFGRSAEGEEFMGLVERDHNRVRVLSLALPEIPQGLLLTIIAGLSFICLRLRSFVYHPARHDRQPYSLLVQ